MSKFFTIKFQAPHDPNGNPRAVFVTFDSQSHLALAAYDAGYQNLSVITNRHHRKAYKGLVIPTTYSEYKAWKSLLRP